MTSSVPPLVAALHIPAASLAEWVSTNVVQTCTLQGLAKLEFRERISVIEKAHQMDVEAKLRVGADHYLQGCVRNRVAALPAYGPASAAPGKRSSPMSSATTLSPISSFGGNSDSRGSSPSPPCRRRECSGRSAHPDSISPTIPFSVQEPGRGQTRPPEWVAELMRGEVDRCRIVRAVSERVGEAERNRLCGIDPFFQFAVCASVIMDSTKWGSPTAAVADFVDRYDIMLAVIAEPVAPPPGRSPTCARLAVFAVGVGLGAVAPGVLAAVAKAKLVDATSPPAVEVLEVNAIAANAISDGFDLAVRGSRFLC